MRAALNVVDNLSIRTKLLLLASCFFLLFLTSILIFFFNSLGAWNSLSRLENEVLVKQELLSDINLNMGYDNGIHSFKNLVLRRDSSYLIQAKEGFQRASKKVKDLLGMREIIPFQHQKLGLVQSVIDEYLIKIELADKLIAEGLKVSEIDQRVKVDDSHAGKALRELNDQLLKLSLQKRKSFIAELKHSTFLLLIVWSIIGFTTMAVVIYINRKFTRDISALVGSMEKVSGGDLNHKIIPSSNDEIGQMTVALEKMRKRLSELIKGLMRSSREVEQFTYVASHDMQEPLRRILMFARTLDQELDRDSEDKRFYVQKILKSAERMQLIVDDLIELSKMKTSKDLWSVFSLRELIKSVWDGVDGSDQVREENFVVIGDANVIGDNNQIYKLFENLFSNCFRYKREDIALRIEINLDNTLRDGYCRISVKDNGKGFASDKVDRIVQPFRRLSKVKPGEGRGMGLAICQKIVEYHGGGRLGVRGEVNQGAEFSFSLPLSIGVKSAGEI